MYSATPSMNRTKTPTGGTAEVVIIIALVLQLLITLYDVYATLVGASILALFGFGGLGAVIAAIVVLVGLFFLYAGFAWVYQRARSAMYTEARPWALVLGILGIFLGFLIVGIVYLVAYIELGSAAREQQAQATPMAPSMGAPIGPPVYAAPPAPGTAPAMPPAPAGAAPPPMTAAPVCPRCGRPGTWIAQYSRYYCYTDQQYL